MGDRTLQCGRRGDALKLWLAWRRHGTAGIAKRVDNAVATSRALVDEVSRRAIEDGTFFPVIANPQFANAPFWAVPPHLREQVRAMARGGLAPPGEGHRQPAPAFTTVAETPSALLEEPLMAALGSSTFPTYEALRKRRRALVNFNPLPDHGLPPFFRAVFNSPAMTPDTVGVVLDEMLAASNAAAQDT